MYEINETRVDEFDFLSKLIEMIADGNGMVVSNAVASLTEISNLKGPVLKMDGATLHKLLTALPECSEWGRVYILDFLALHMVKDGKDIDSAITRIIPHLSHSNAAVVLSAAKVLIRYMDFVTDPEKLRSINRKLAPSLGNLFALSF